MRNILFIAVLVFSYTFSFAQGPSLKPSITEDEYPKDGDGIYVEKVPETKGWDNFEGGFKKGTVMPDLTLYTLDGKEMNLATVLRETHKPVLLVSGNYSCNVFRRNLDEINEITKFYEGKLNVYLIYTIEAHPVAGIQAYPFIPPAVAQNKKEGVAMKQPSTYLGRRKNVAEMNKHLKVVPTIVIDGPENGWWSNAGQAPNNAYLINTHGVIVAKNGWFNSSMWCSIDKLLHTHSGKCGAKKAAAPHKTVTHVKTITEK